MPSVLHVEQAGLVRGAPEGKPSQAGSDADRAAPPEPRDPFDAAVQSTRAFAADLVKISGQEIARAQIHAVGLH